MNNHTLLRKTVTLARTGNQEAFENLYILTVQNIYGKICFLTADKEQEEELLLETYRALYDDVQELSLEEEQLLKQIDQKILYLAEEQFGISGKDFPEEDFSGFSEEVAATLWMKLEEKIGFEVNTEDSKEEKGSLKSYLFSSIKVLLATLILVLTIFILYKAGNLFYERRSQKAVAVNKEVEQKQGTLSSNIVIENILEKPGWERHPNGKLYYVKKDGTLADGAVMQGKQMLTFSRDGELTLIGSNKAVEDDETLSFDEETSYKIKNGDLYRVDPNGTNEEECMIRNGHIVQADFRCGFLWYVCKYQIPNSEQVKTIIYRAERDGKQAKELYTTDSILETTQFQLTDGFLYYLSDEMLFRKNLITDETELLAENVEYYFAWEETAFYMKERTLEAVSEGMDYSGIEAGYQIEFQDQKFILLNESGSQISEGVDQGIQIGDRIYGLEKGAISSVKPAVRECKETSYYLDGAGKDRKIYWRNNAGSQGLIRQEGLYVDSLCISGQWLYYSARIAQYGDEIESQIYRVDLETMELEKVGDSFRGYMRNLYYFEHVQTIYGEYIPSIADKEAIHGKIAVITVGEDVEVINDIKVRPEGEGSDMLELVMVSGSRIYCFYHSCSYDKETGDFKWETTKPLMIQLTGKSS